MKLYLAAPWVDRNEMPAIAALFEAQGHTITCKWWATPDIPEGENRDADLQACAVIDRDGVRTADVLVVFNTAKSEGKAVEQGIAINMNKPIIAIGKRGEVSKNVFHYLPLYRWVDSVGSAIATLGVVEWLVSNAR
jgi:hypothetical protein